MNRRAVVRQLLIGAGLGSLARGRAQEFASCDPLAIEPPMVVVNGLDPSELNERYLDMLKAGGVACWHKSMQDVQSFANVYDFTDAHRPCPPECP